MPNSIDVSKPLAAGQTHGSLTVVGTGIRSISHFTQEAIGHIRDADAVFFAVPDGITANFIRELNPSAYNLALHYGEDKRRLITYVQMAEVILRAVRQGKRVAAVFYGHPGFFVSPARRALNIARKEGHHTEMLPGISSTDYLFSDLRIDPAVNGCQILEASDMLMRNRPVVTSSHVVLLQVGSVGDSFYSVKGFKNNKRAILFERLIELYGENHPSYHYVGATFPGLDSQIIRRPLKAYRDPKVRASVHAACTFYLPPKEVLPFDVDMVERLGMTPPQGTADKSAGGYQLRGGDYGPFELEAISLLGTEPPGGREQSTPKALYRILSQMAGSPDAAEAYRRDAKTYVSIFSGLSPAEKAALTQRSAPALHAVALQIDRTVAVPSPLPGSDNVKPAVPTAPVAAVAVGTAVKNDATELHDADELHDATELHKSDELHDASELHKADELHDASELHKADELHDASELHKADELHDASELHKADELHDASELHKADELHDASELHKADELHDASELHKADELHDASELHKADELHDASELHKADELHDASELHKADELHDASELHKADELHDASELHKADELHDASELHKADELHDASELHKADELHDASELHKADELHDASELHKADELHDASELHKADELHDASELHQSDELHDASEVEGSDTDR